MSGRSPGSSKVIVTASGSVRGASNGVKFAGDDAKDKMYEPKQSQKLCRVLTVVAYLFSVSLAAIILSVYYVFLWNPRNVYRQQTTPAIVPVCPQIPPVSGQVVIPEPRVQDAPNEMHQSAYVTPSNEGTATYSPLIELLTQISSAPQISTTETLPVNNTRK